MTEKKSEEHVAFGFQRVEKDQKKTLVQDVFSSVASRYDVMNDAMSFGLHRLWKEKLIKLLPDFEDKAMWVDVAGGTGDLPLRYLAKNPSKDIDIYVVDPNEAMLNAGRDKSIDLGFVKQLQWIEAYGEKVPLKKNSADVYTNSFGMRNVNDIEKVIAEAYRMLKPGGTFLCMEFTTIDKAPFKKPYDFYLFKVIPQMGKLIAKDEDSYRYLAESIHAFVKPVQFIKMLEEAGFERPTFDLLNLGGVALYKALKPL